MKQKLCIRAAALIVPACLFALSAHAQVVSLVKDINPGPSSSAPVHLISAGSVIFFSADNGTTGQELWTSDGSAAGTHLVRDIYPGSTGSSPDELICVGGQLFFVASDNVSGRELWTSDGTEAGTTIVKDIQDNSSSTPDWLTGAGGILYFSADNATYGRELWKSDGTENGTMLVKNIGVGALAGSPEYPCDVGGTLFFSAFDSPSGRELWTSDGTEAGTTLVKDICSGACDSAPAGLVNVGGTLFFSAYDSISGRELWRSDGTEIGTTLVKNISDNTTSSSPGWLTGVGATLYFAADNGACGNELWTSDGTAAGTTLVRDINSGAGSSFPEYLTDFNGTLFFVAADNATAAGRELGTSDGTGAGTIMVMDINPGPGSGLAGNPSFTPTLPGPGSTIFFVADNGIAGRELWRSDGTLGGTAMLQDISPGFSSSNPSEIVLLPGMLLFAADGDNSTQGQELWRAAQAASTTSSISGGGSSSSSGGGAAASTTSTAPTTTIPGSSTTTTRPSDFGITIDFIAAPVAGPAPLRVRFINTSTNTTAGFRWDFGDGTTSSEEGPVHIYTSAGVYSVTLVALTSRGEIPRTRDSYITVNAAPPAADFSGAPVTGNAPLAVQFSDLSRGKITRWIWDFGDGSSAAVQNPLHVYTETGTYSVSLTVSDGRASASIAKQHYISVTLNAPAADFIASVTEGDAPLAVLFSDTSRGNITERVWNFGDGSTGDQQLQEHTYSVPGAYTVALKASGPEGLSEKVREDFVTVRPAFFTYAISGLIAGDIAAGVEVSLNGPRRMTAVTSEGGAYEFSGAANGRYTVTPVMRGIAFDPSSRQITVAGSDITGVDFTARSPGPILKTLYASPEQAPADNATQVLFLVQVFHPEGTDAVEAVSIDLSPINGNGPANMHDDGTGGDGVAGDGLYGLRATVGIDTPPGPATLYVRAVDTAGLTASACIILDVISFISDIAEPGGARTYRIANLIAGQTLKISFALEGGTADNASARRVQNSSCYPTLDIFTPEGKPYFAEGLTISGANASVEIISAAAGSWTYAVSNPCQAAQTFNIQTTAAGTGLVSGIVINAETGEGLNGAAVTTNGGGSSTTSEGYYVLVHPAGVFTVTASAPSLTPASRSFRLDAGRSVEVSMALGIGADDNGTCFLSGILNPGDESYCVLQSLRDAVLAKTAEGRRCIMLYYQYSPEISAMLARDPALGAEIAGCVRRHLPLALSMLKGERVQPSAGQVRATAACLKHLQEKVGPGLSREIGTVVRRLQSGRITTNLHPD